MKYILATIVTCALLEALVSGSTSGTNMAASESCVNIMTGDWDKCVVTNAGLPVTGGYGGGSKILMMMTRATI